MDDTSIDWTKAGRILTSPDLGTSTLAAPDEIVRTPGYHGYTAEQRAGCLFIIAFKGALKLNAQGE